MAALAAPLDEKWMTGLVREAGRKWWSMDLDGMALLLHGLAQYGHRCGDGTVCICVLVTLVKQRV